MSEEQFMLSERLAFRCWREEDIELAMTLWGDKEVTKLIDARGQLTAEQVRERVLLEMAMQDEHGFQYWPLLTRSDASFVGCCGLRPRHDGQGGVKEGVAELGVHICKCHWGVGYATEAARRVISHAKELGLDALFAGHHPGNTASRSLLLKLGFKYTHDELYPPTGLQHPSYTLPLDGVP